MNDPYSSLRFSFEVEHSKQIKVDHKLSQSVVLRADRKKSLDLSVGKIKVTFLIFSVGLLREESISNILHDIYSHSFKVTIV